MFQSIIPRFLIGLEEGQSFRVVLQIGRYDFLDTATVYNLRPNRLKFAVESRAQTRNTIEINSKYDNSLKYRNFLVAEDGYGLYSTFWVELL